MISPANAFKTSKTISQRAGIATLELTLSLPVVLAVFVGMIWLGFSVIAQSRVAVAARHEAWTQRFEPWSNDPFDFSSDDTATGESQEDVRVTQLLDDPAGAKASQRVEKGPWAHQSVKFDSAPNWSLHADMMIAAKTAGLKADYQDFRERIQQLEQMGSEAIAAALREALAELINPSNFFENASGHAERGLELDEELERKRLEGKVADLKQSLTAAEQALKEAKEADEPDEELIWIREQTINRLELELETTEELLADL